MAIWSEEHFSYPHPLLALPGILDCFPHARGWATCLLDRREPPISSKKEGMSMRSRASYRAPATEMLIEHCFSWRTRFMRRWRGYCKYTLFFTKMQYLWKAMLIYFVDSFRSTIRLDKEYFCSTMLNHNHRKSPSLVSILVSNGVNKA